MTIAFANHPPHKAYEICCTSFSTWDDELTCSGCHLSVLRALDFSLVFGSHRLIQIIVKTRGESAVIAGLSRLLIHKLRHGNGVFQAGRNFLCGGTHLACLIAAGGWRNYGAGYALAA